MTGVEFMKAIAEIFDLIFAFFALILSIAAWFIARSGVSKRETEDKIDTVKAELTAEIDKIDQDLRENRESIVRVEERVNALPDTEYMDKVHTRISAVKTIATDTKEELAAIGATVTSIDKAVGTLQKVLHKHD